MIGGLGRASSSSDITGARTVEWLNPTPIVALEASCKHYSFQERSAGDSPAATWLLLSADLQVPYALSALKAPQQLTPYHDARRIWHTVYRWPVLICRLRCKGVLEMGDQAFHRLKYAVVLFLLLLLPWGSLGTRPLDRDALPPAAIAGRAAPARSCCRRRADLGTRCVIHVLCHACQPFNRKNRPLSTSLPTPPAREARREIGEDGRQLTLEGLASSQPSTAPLFAATARLGLEPTVTTTTAHGSARGREAD